MELTPYLSFDGQCGEAFKLYEKVLGGKIVFSQTYGDSPMAKDMPPESHGRVMHTTLVVGERTLQGADSPPGGYQKPQGMSISIALKNVAESERIYKELSEGGQVHMELQQTFWAARFGMFVDRFGIPWMINCENPTA